MVGVDGQWKLTVNYTEKFSMIQQPKRITPQYKRSSGKKHNHYEMPFSRCVGKFLVPFTVNLLSTPDLIPPFDQFPVSAMKNRNLTFVLKSPIKSEMVAVNSSKMWIHCAGGACGALAGQVEGNFMRRTMTLIGNMKW
jgi:hypothetical protein